MSVNDVMKIADEFAFSNFTRHARRADLRAAIEAYAAEQVAPYERRAKLAEAVLLRKGMLPCDDCGKWCSVQMLPIHRCSARAQEQQT